MADNTSPGASATTSTSRSPLNTIFAQQSSFTEEHFSFIIYHVAKGTSSSDILITLNSTFTVEQNISDLEEAIAYIRRNGQRERQLLRRAKKYAWYMPEPLPDSDSRLSRGYEQLYTEEMKAFMIWKYHLGLQRSTVLDSLNTLFKTNHNTTSFKITLTNLLKNERAVHRLEQDAKDFDWWKPPPSEDSAGGKRVARAGRLREAQKRMAKKAEEQKQWWETHETIDPEAWKAPDSSPTKKRMMDSPTAASIGSQCRPIKIEDSDSDEGKLDDGVLAHFNDIADTMEGSPSAGRSITRSQGVSDRRSKSPDDDPLKELSNSSDDDETEDFKEENLDMSPRSRYRDRRGGLGVSDLKAKLMRSRS
ncbi:MAG: hypothetical protein M1830_004617 [Pleopsidium flavum]|nr:MAG: hypothetical protein M1830_004617 [Pleopsidium flavum]